MLRYDLEMTWSYPVMVKVDTDLVSDIVPEIAMKIQQFKMHILNPQYCATILIAYSKYKS